MDSTGRRIESVLVVDDDSAFLRACQRGGFGQRDVTTAATVDEAWDSLGRRAFDLAVVDLRLGSASGLDLLAGIKNAHRSTFTVLISGYMSVAYAVIAMRAGVDTVLCKPVSCTEILEHAEAGDTPPSQDYARRVEAPTLARAEWEHITRVLVDSRGNISLAARRLGIYRQSLQRKLRKLPPRQ